MKPLQVADGPANEQIMLTVGMKKALSFTASFFHSAGPRAFPLAVPASSIHVWTDGALQGGKVSMGAVLVDQITNTQLY